MANPELCLSEFQNTIPTFVPAVLHTFSDYQKWYRFRTPIQNFEILVNLVFSKANQGVKSLSDIFQINIFPKFFFSKFEIWGNFVFGKASQGVRTLSDIFHAKG